MIADSYLADGAQLKDFIDGAGDQPDQKGNGNFVDGDYWEVKFKSVD